MSAYGKFHETPRPPAKGSQADRKQPKSVTGHPAKSIKSIKSIKNSARKSY